MTVIKFKNFIKLSQKEKEMVLEWRNSDRIRLKMSNQEIISLGDHLRYIDNLKNRTDCVYYLICVDEVPIGVIDSVYIKEEDIRMAGSYIGNTDYLGYGLLLCYLDIKKHFEDYPESIKYANVLKSNKRVYRMHKEIFKAKDLSEDEIEWRIYWDASIWAEIKDTLKETIYDSFNVEKVIYED